jgi:peptide/nickel transport system permease protein
VGKSLASRRDVAPELRERLWNTLELAGLAAIISVPLAIMLGLMAAVWNGGLLDRLTSMLSLIVVSVPEFFIAYLLIALLSLRMGWLPSLSVVMGDDATVWDHLRAIALPTLTLVLVVVAHMMRLTRAAVIGVLDSPFIEMLVLKGVPNWRIILQHAVPNVLGPIINVVAVNLAYLIVGVVVVETVFVYPGLGQYMVDSVSKRDIPVVQTCGLIFATIYVGLNAVADMLGVLVNPRLRHPR